MKVIKYKYMDIDEPGWKFSEIEFSNLNLLVGDTATGKTRFMNTFYNLSDFIVHNNFKLGHWKVTFEHQSITYTMELKSIPGDIQGKSGKIITDCIWKHDKGNLIPIIERTNDKLFVQKKEIETRLSSAITSISLFQEDPDIKPIYDAFGLILRRSFFIEQEDNVLKLSAILPQHAIKESLTEDQLLDQIFRLQTNLNISLYLLKKHSYKTYKELLRIYKQIFPFIGKMKITDFSEIAGISLPGKIPVFCIQEVNSEEWVPQNQLSSGMVKILLLLNDVYILPSESIYLIDEYENSLGISAINFFPEFISTLDKDIQFLITSHHPYLINNIPVKNWFVFHRTGVNVEIKYGQELVKKYGKSKQQAFLQLINDPFYKR
jgi:hypothetical protein